MMGSTASPVPAWPGMKARNVRIVSTSGEFKIVLFSYGSRSLTNSYFHDLVDTQMIVLKVNVFTCLYCVCVCVCICSNELDTFMPKICNIHTFRNIIG